MTNIMFDIPSRDDGEEVIITRECVTDKAYPKLVLKTPKLEAPAEAINISDLLAEGKKAE